MHDGMKGLIGIMTMAMLFLARGELERKEAARQEDSPSWLPSQPSSELRWDASDWIEAASWLRAGGNQVSARRSWQTAHRLNRSLPARQRPLITFATFWTAENHDKILSLVHSIVHDSLVAKAKNMPRVVIFMDSACSRQMRDELQLWSSVRFHQLQSGVLLSSADDNYEQHSHQILQQCLQMFDACIVLPPNVAAVSQRDLGTSVVDQISTLLLDEPVVLQPLHCFSHRERSTSHESTCRLIGAANLASLDAYLSSDQRADTSESSRKACLFIEQPPVKDLCSSHRDARAPPVVMVWPLESHFRLPRSPSRSCRATCLFVPPLPALLGSASAVLIHVPSLDKSSPQLPPVKCDGQMWVHFSQESRGYTGTWLNMSR